MDVAGGCRNGRLAQQVDQRIADARVRDAPDVRRSLTLALNVAIMTLSSRVERSGI
jgi:hypothetical protein